MITCNIGKYIRDKGISISRIAEATGISDQILYRCFDENSTRELKGGELLLVCKFLEVNPYDFFEAA